MPETHPHDAWGRCRGRLLALPELVIGRSPFEMEAIFDDLRAPAFAQFDRGEPTSAGLAVDANCGYDDGTAVALGHELERLRLPGGKSRSGRTACKAMTGSAACCASRSPVGKPCRRTGSSATTFSRGVCTLSSRIWTPLA